MQNVSHKKKWNAGLLQLHVDPPPITLIKIKHNDKSENDFVKIKLRKHLTSENSDLYESKWTCFTTVIRKLFLFAHNFKRTLEASGTL